MSKLKVGDKVRTILAYPWTPSWRGLPGTVVEVLATGEVVVTFASGDIVESHERDFELIETKGLASEEELLQLQDTLPKPDEVSPDGATEVNPSHYDFPGGVQVKDVSAHLTSFGGQALQYIARATRLDGMNKGDTVTDLRKAIKLLEWEVERMEGISGSGEA